MTLHAPKILGMIGIALNDDNILSNCIHNSMDSVLVPLETDLAGEWDRWAKFYQQQHPGYLDTYSFIILLENAAQFSEKDKQRINFMVDHHIQSLYLPEIDAVIQLQQCFAELEKISSENTKKWVYFIEISNESGVQQLPQIIQWMKSVDKVFFIVLNRQKLSIDTSPECMYKVALIQTSTSEACHQHDIPVIISNGFFESMKKHIEPSIAEVCDIWTVLQCDVQGIWFREELAEGSHPVEILQKVNSIIANYITESKAKSSKE